MLGAFMKCFESLWLIWLFDFFTHICLAMASPSSFSRSLCYVGEWVLNFTFMFSSGDTIEPIRCGVCNVDEGRLQEQI